jgi:hypothetical protein
MKQAGELRPGSSPLLAACRELEVQDHPPAVAAALARSPETAGLVKLRLSRCELGDADVAALAASPHLGSLRELSLSSNAFGAAGVAALLEAPFVRRLVRLDLCTPLIDRALRLLARTDALGGLCELRLTVYESAVRDELREKYGWRLVY